MNSVIIKSYFFGRTKTKIKKAIILAGGQKTRLNPLDKHRPVWMLPIINRPLIEFIIDSLKKNGIEEVTIAMSGSDEIPDKLKEYKSPNINIHFYREDKPRGTAGSIKDLEGFICEETFVVINSNIFAGDINLSRAIQFHHKMKSIATAGVYRDAGIGDVKESVCIASDGKIKSYHMIHSSIDKRSPWKYSGIYIFSPVILGFINGSSYMDIKEQLIPALQRKSLNVFAYEIEGCYRYLESVNDYLRVQRDILLERVTKGLYFDKKEEAAEKVWTGKDVKISPKSYLLGPIVIGDGCTIEDRAQIIGPAVIGNRCKISRGVLIRESILWDDISLSNGAKIEYSILGERSYVPDNSNIKNTILLDGLKDRDNNLPSDYSVKSIIDLSGIVSIAGDTQKIYKTVKRITDVALSAVGIFLLLPIFFLIAIAVKIDSPGPVFYIQKRCGIRGKLFGMIKFRTMVTNAEKLYKKLIAKKETDGPIFKISNDPRITGLGRILRKTSLDEIPQLLNVLKGEMSLVGPRPLIMDEMKFSPSWRDTRLKVKPGITGLWQIQGRSEASFHDWIRYDVYYVKNQSLWLDIKILFKTIKVVLKKVGAY